MTSRSIRENRRWLTERAQLEPNYPGAIAAARRLGFGCQGYRPRSLICRLLGHHVRPFAMRTCSSDGSWSIDANCCQIGGHHYPQKDVAAPVKFKHWSLRQMLVDILRLLLPPPPKVKPSGIPTAHLVRLEAPSLWEPGSSAFWLDPELWSRTPEVNGRPEICWMFLDRRPAGPKRARLRNRVTLSDGTVLERQFVGDHLPEYTAS